MSKSRRNTTELRELLDALCEESITDAQASRLERMLAEDAAAREYYVQYMSMYASLERYAVGAAAEERDEPPMAIAAHRTETIDADLAGADRAVVARPRMRMTRWAVAAAVALLVGVGAMVMTMTTDAPRGDDVATNNGTTDAATHTLPPSATLVDVADAEWVDLPGTDEQMLAAGAEVGAGRLHLRRGAAQMVLDSGAVVTMLGDTQLDLTGPNRVYLRSGRLVAHVPDRARGFTVDGPGVLVVDHGTEFGVSVDADSVAEVHVFAGHVNASLVNDAGVVTQTTPLRATDDTYAAARLAPRKYSVRPIAAERHRFAASARPLPVFNTGRGLTLGQVDPHWTVEGPDVPRRNAVVASHPSYVPNEPDTSQWLSFDPRGVAPANSRYTFTTRFDMTGLDPATARLHGRFSADNQVAAIRLNGKPLPVPEHPWEWAGFTRFSITDGLVDGTNTLEFVVHNAFDNGPPNPMALRVELAGTALSIDTHTPSD